MLIPALNLTPDSHHKTATVCYPLLSPACGHSTNKFIECKPVIFNSPARFTFPSMIKSKTGNSASRFGYSLLCTTGGICKDSLTNKIMRIICGGKAEMGLGGQQAGSSKGNENRRCRLAIKRLVRRLQLDAKWISQMIPTVAPDRCDQGQLLYSPDTA